MFLPFICLSAVNIVCWRFWAFACASGCFVAWRLVLRWYVSFMPLFARFVRGFVGLLLLSVILSLSGGRRLCVCCVRRFLRFVRLFLTAVCVFQHFCVNWCFLCCFPTFVWFFNSCLFFFCCACFFCANFSSLLMSVFIFFSAVECCLLRFVFFCFKSVLFVLFIEFCVSWRFVLLNMSFFAVDYAFFVFFWRFFVRFESCLSFFRIACWVLHGLAACFA